MLASRTAVEQWQREDDGGEGRGGLGSHGATVSPFLSLLLAFPLLFLLPSLFFFHLSAWISLTSLCANISQHPFP